MRRIHWLGFSLMALVAVPASAEDEGYRVLTFSVPATVTARFIDNDSLSPPPAVGSSFLMTGIVVFSNPIVPISRVGGFVLNADQDGFYDYEIYGAPLISFQSGFSGDGGSRVPPVFTFLDGKLNRIDFSNSTGDGLFFFDLFSLGADVSYKYGDIDEQGNEEGAGYAASLDYASSTFGGYPLAAVPEPATWALMVSGFGLVGGALRRRTRIVTTAA